MSLMFDNIFLLVRKGIEKADFIRKNLYILQ